ncbi:MAG TPA: endonuclease/exonuclease/phosphatase family protein, partial [Chthoniobacteraceae bacterium]|nr:endonuclease/exonuclease/phosphatase family protein [Chthoniobacteraceae bacterium]
MKFPPFPLILVWISWSAPLSAAPAEIVVCEYNVRNYINSEPPPDGQKFGTKAKPQAEIDALVRIVKEISPDILGICEMGTPDRFEDFKQRLAACGLGYTDFEYVQAADQQRHLALLSRFPIVARQSAPNVPFELDGRLEKVRRGFLDVTVQVTPQYRLRLVGAHLKSKLPAAEGEALVRRHEAQELRKHLDAILTADPRTNLICYGDFNDTKNQPMFQEIAGARGTPSFMADLAAKDSLGERWTFYWKTSDEYSRIDYLFASPGLLREVVKDKSIVYRGPEWDVASDHRAVYTSIVP